MKILGFCLLVSIALPAWTADRYSCQDTSEHRQFDFWVGTWQVTDSARDKVYGSNTISIEQGGCLLLERWQSAGGGTGSSMNYYSPEDGAWHQLWVDEGSSIIDIAGSLEDGSMVLAGHIYYLGDNRRAAFRGRWTPLPDGSVRQFFEEQDAEGQWQPWFEGYYHRADGALQSASPEA
jgi:hypothetical protein